LKGRDPQALYDRQCEIQACHVDRCWLYVARCAYILLKAPIPNRKIEMVELEGSAIVTIRPYSSVFHA